MRPMWDLELREVRKAFGPVRAVDGVSVQVSKGEFLSLLGPSGCGKTTTLRLVAGFERPTAGDVLLQGIAVNDVPPYRRDVNTVFQHYALFPHLTVFENIAFGLRVRRRPFEEIRRRVAEMLEVVQLPGYEARLPNQLSGGEQQRVALARALINHPSVLLLDEPLGALDLLVRKHMQLELKRIHRAVGVTFVYVTHDQEEALTLSDRVVVMNRGRVEQVGIPTEVYERPATPFVLHFVGSSNTFEGMVEEAEGSVCSIRTADGLVLAAPRPDALAPGQRALAAVRPERVRLGDPPAEAENRAEGAVEDVIFQGVLTHLLVRIAPARLLTVALPSRG